MENWGLITYCETCILIDPNVSSSAQLYGLQSVQAHELSHQWFGDLVTCEWWSVLWLNEGFATYVSYYGVDSISKESKAFEQFIYDDYDYALQRDASPGSHEMSEVVDYPQEANFGSITYSKGGSVIRMTESFITQGTWIKGLTNYLLAYQYSFAAPDYLFSYWDQAAKEDHTLSSEFTINDILDTWTTQKNFPLVTVTRDYNEETALISQQRFLDSQDNTGDTHEYKWWIPISFSSIGDENENFDNTYNHGNWLPASRNNITLFTGSGNAPIIFNVRATGFYRTKYDSENYQRIAAALNNNHERIPIENRAMLLSDVYYITEAGYLPDFNTLNMLTDYTYNETAYIPLSMAKAIYVNLVNTFSLPADGETVKSKLEDMFIDQYAKVGMAYDSEMTFTEKRAQQTIIDANCRYDQPQCVSDAQSQFNAWMNSATPDDLSTNPCNKEARAIIYCTAVRNGGSAELNFIRERQANARDPQERSNLNTASGCASLKSDLVAHLHHISYLQDGFNLRELADVLSYNSAFLPALKEIILTGQAITENLTRERFVHLLAEALRNVGSQKAAYLTKKLITLFENAHAVKDSRLYDLDSALHSINKLTRYA